MKKKWKKMSNGYGLFIYENGIGGRQYWTDEIGGGVCIWDTSLVEEDSILEAMIEERAIKKLESMNLLDKYPYEINPPIKR